MYAKVGGLAMIAVLFGGNLLAGQKKGTVLIDSIQGQDLYKAYCASCHGMDATGHGAMEKSLTVKPSDLTRITVRNGGMFPLTRIEKIIAGEEIPPNGHGTSEMPVWGPFFSRVERDQDVGRVRIDNLARFLRDIQVK